MRTCHLNQLKLVGFVTDVRTVGLALNFLFCSNICVLKCRWKKEEFIIRLSSFSSWFTILSTMPGHVRLISSLWLTPARNESTGIWLEAAGLNTQAGGWWCWWWWWWWGNFWPDCGLCSDLEFCWVREVLFHSLNDDENVSNGSYVISICIIYMRGSIKGFIVTTASE